MTGLTGSAGALTATTGSATGGMAGLAAAVATGGAAVDGCDAGTAIAALAAAGEMGERAVSSADSPQSIAGTAAAGGPAEAACRLGRTEIRAGGPSVRVILTVDGSAGSGDAVVSAGAGTALAMARMRTRAVIVCRGSQFMRRVVTGLRDRRSRARGPPGRSSRRLTKRPPYSSNFPHLSAIRAIRRDGCRQAPASGIRPIERRHAAGICSFSARRRR